MSPPSSLLDHLIRPLQERRRDRQVEGLGGCAEAHHSLKILSASDQRHQRRWRRKGRILPEKIRVQDPTGP
jgi:hypothetical protein